MPMKIHEFYDRQRDGGVDFTKMMYAFGLFGASQDRRNFAGFANMVLGGMIAHGYTPDVGHRIALLRGASRRKDIAAALENFEALESG